MKLLHSAIKMILQVEDSGGKAALAILLLPGAVLKIPSDTTTVRPYCTSVV